MEKLTKVRFNGQQRYSLGLFEQQEDGTLKDISYSDISFISLNKKDNFKTIEIKEKTLDYYPNESNVKKQLDKKAKLMRLWRYKTKAFNNDFNYFATITYDSKKCNEKTFHDGLLNCFREFKRKNKNFRYIGAFERGSKTERLHFHCILNIDKFVPILITKHNLKNNVNHLHKCHPYFYKKFGLCDFTPIDRESFDYVHHINYITKYLLKSDGYCEIHLSRGILDYELIDSNELAHFSYFDGFLVESPIFFRKKVKK